MRSQSYDDIRIDKYHIGIAAQDDLYDLVVERIDLRMDSDFFVIDGDDEVEVSTRSVDLSQ